MIKLTPAPTFAADVGIMAPGKDEPQTIRIVFRHKTRTQFRAWWESVSGKTDEENLSCIIDSWSGVVSDVGAEVPYSREALDALLDGYPTATLAILKAYQSALFEGKQKNS